MSFPKTRLRRLRYNPILRNLVSENSVSVNDLIYPIFICKGKNKKKEISSMPGQFQLSIDNAVDLCKSAVIKGVKSILLFGIPAEKDEHGHVACSDNSIVQKAIKAIKKECDDILLIADICNCEYTTHGHCGTIIDGDVDNDSTLETLAAQSISLAKAGADIIAPSDMMDGRIGKIRQALDKSNYQNVQILSYAAKYASSFYGPFRDAVGSKGSLKGDKKTYQMDFRNSDEALREVALDINEGADMVMVKPGMPYLDIIKSVKEKFKIPVLAYQVSGEYSLISNAIQKKLVNEDVVVESLMAFKRAGANAIVSYYADRIDKILK